MKRKINFLAVVIIAISLTSCSYVEPNNEGVLMQHYGKNGRSDFSVVTGKVWTMNPATELYNVPMFEQRGDCKALVVFASDGGQFTVDPTYSYQPIRGRGIDIIYNYKNLMGDMFFDNIEANIMNPRVLNAYREEARNFNTDSLMNNVKSFETSVQTRLLKEFTEQNFTLKELSSNLTPPKSMLDAIEKRNNAIQQAIQIKNELETAKMYAQKLEIEAKAQANANEILTKSLTPKLVNLKFIERWDGKSSLYGITPQYYKNIK